VSAFERAPFLVVWETTRACALACVHCRAEAMPHRSPDELTPAEGRRLIDRVAAFGDPPPMLVLTGGDPLRRPDITDLVAHGTARGIAVSMTPSGTAAVTEAKLRALRDAGLVRLAVSLDGASADTHDAFRQVRGSHGYTHRIIERVRALGLPLQVNTTVCRQTLADLPALATQMVDVGAVLWALFFLIPVGRARADQALSAGEIEQVLLWAAELAPRMPFGIKTTEAPHWARVRSQRMAAHDRASAGGALDPAATRSPRPDAVGRAGRAVTDGNGFVFIDHVGTICPSGFLPLPAGNVREDDLVTVYREDPLFVALRDPSRLGGRCGRCEYRDRCGGSRARAYALTGDPLAEDPGCIWQCEAQPKASRAPDSETCEAQPAARGEHRPASVSEPASRAPNPSHAEGGAGGPDAAAVTTEQIMDALSGVLDPELGLSVVELGLVYDVAIRGRAVAITMTLTAPGCPLHEVMPAWVRNAVMALPGVDHVEVALAFDPPWTPERIEPTLTP
jgi:radical SAM protein